MVSLPVVPKLVPSLQGAIDAGQKICMLEASMVAIQGAFKIPDANVIPMDAQGPTIERMYNGDCAAAIVGKNDYTTFILGSKQTFTVCTDEADEKHLGSCADEDVEPELFALECTCKDFTKPVEECRDECPYARRYCPVQLVSDPAFQFEFTFALPVRSSFQPATSAWLSKIKTQGTMIEMVSKYITKPTPDVCTVTAGEASPLKLKDMMGVTIIGTGVMLCGMFLTCFASIGAMALKKKAGGDAGEEDVTAIPEEGAAKIVDTSAMSAAECVALAKDQAKKLRAMIDALPITAATTRDAAKANGDANGHANGDTNGDAKDASKAKDAPKDDDFLGGIGNWWQSSVVEPVTKQVAV